MQVTRFRVNGEKATPSQLGEFEAGLQIRLDKAGFHTCVELSVSGGKIGLHMKQFTIDVDKLGRNADMGWTNNYGFSGGASRSTKGWKYTNIPTWEQREQFNRIINDYFNTKGVTCRIVSGPFLVRCADHGANPVDHYDTYEGWALRKGGGMPYQTNMPDLNRIIQVTPEMEAEAKDVMRARRRELRLQKEFDTQEKPARAALHIVKG